MSGYSHIRVEEVDGGDGVGPVTVITLLDRRLMDIEEITEAGNELLGLLQQEAVTKVVVDFSRIEFFASMMLTRLQMFGKRASLEREGKLRAEWKLCGMRPEIYEVFAITRLNHCFDIEDSKEEAIASFKA